MSLEGYALAESTFDTDRGVSLLDPNSGSSYTKPLFFNVKIPTGSAERAYITGGSSITIIDANGEGVCKPRLVAVASLSVKIINSTNAVPASPFTSVVANRADVNALGGFLSEVMSADSLVWPAPEA